MIREVLAGLVSFFYPHFIAPIVSKPDEFEKMPEISTAAPGETKLSG
jgi:hypothetical protein